jgi:hypothetical protein
MNRISATPQSLGKRLRGPSSHDCFYAANIKTPRAWFGMSRGAIRKTEKMQANLLIMIGLNRIVFLPTSG